jgi:hypothetical protein
MPIGRQLCLNLPTGVAITQRSLDASSKSNAQHCMQMSIFEKHLQLWRLRRISMIQGKECCVLPLMSLSSSLKSATQQTLLSFIMTKVGAANSKALHLDGTLSSFIKCCGSFWNAPQFDCGTGHACFVRGSSTFDQCEMQLVVRAWIQFTTEELVACA